MRTKYDFSRFEDFMDEVGLDDVIKDLSDLRVSFLELQLNNANLSAEEQIRPICFDYEEVQNQIYTIKRLAELFGSLKPVACEGNISLRMENKAV
jgi:hypothetical protein